MKKHQVLGLMSGTSLDGLDLAYVTFEKTTVWQFQLIACESVPFDAHIREQLTSAPYAGAASLKALDLQFGRWLGEQVRTFLSVRQLKPDLVVSHGHTIFHQPEEGLTLQIGDGYQLMLACGIKTICDLRSLDVALGGQGAPLVPVGDKLLFGEYDFCLNLGGFSNISFDRGSARIAFDICPVNTVLNKLASRLGLPFDRDGDLARSGRTNQIMLERLNALPYYAAKPPKSLGIEWVEEHIFPMLAEDSIENLLNTFTHHIATQIARSLTASNATYINKAPKLLLTGGGAKNIFLIECLKSKLRNAIELVLPEEQIIDFKEAIIFAFLGLLRMRGAHNTWKSVTGAKCDSSGGMLFDPNVM